MSDFQWEHLSNQAIAAAGLVYFLALLSHLIEWSALRTVPVDASAKVPVTAGAVSDSGADAGPEAVSDPEPGAVSDGGGAAAEQKRFRIEMFGRLGLLLATIGCAIHFVGLVGRGMAADPNRVPWSNMYEFTITGSFVVVLGYLLLRRRYRLDWMGPIIMALEVVLLMVAVLVLYEPIEPLSQALVSYWLVVHVVSAIIATGAFTLGGITSALYLIKARSQAKGESDHGYIARLPSLPTLDRVSYRIHAFGFPVWTFAVLISGPIWAHEAWSSYWNWDPKEVCAFITWVLYAAYLHARSTAGWKGRNAAILSLVGLASLWFNFIGINYFSTTSQHSYTNGTSQVSLHDPGR